MTLRYISHCWSLYLTACTHVLWLRSKLRFFSHGLHWRPVSGGEHQRQRSCEFVDFAHQLALRSERWPVLAVLNGPSAHSGKVLFDSSTAWTCQWLSWHFCFQFPRSHSCGATHKKAEPLQATANMTAARKAYRFLRRWSILTCFILSKWKERPFAVLESVTWREFVSQCSHPPTEINRFDPWLSGSHPASCFQRAFGWLSLNGLDVFSTYERISRCYAHVTYVLWAIHAAYSDLRYAITDICPL